MKTMSQCGVEIVIGKLLTDEVFRRRFEQCGREWLTSIGEHGIHLDDMEIAALTEAGARIWRQMASRIDRRLQRHDAGTGTPATTLTAREHHVLRGVFEGLTNKQIAAEVGVTEPAVKSTIQQLFRKTHVRTRALLVRVAIQGTGPTVSSQRGRP
jgi:DNA-binding NarL/FixJ family response regulator